VDDVAGRQWSDRLRSIRPTAIAGSIGAIGTADGHGPDRPDPHDTATIHARHRREQNEWVSDDHRRSAIDRILGRMPIDAVVRNVDVQGVIERVDINALLDRIDLNRVLARVDIQALVERVDLDRLLRDVDIDALAARIDVERLVARTDLGRIVLDSTTGVGTRLLDSVRSQGVGLDRFVNRWADRILRRNAEETPDGPPLLVGRMAAR
jgi:hypothetical protein